MKILVCGGRSYNNTYLINETLKRYDITLLIHGSCSGADDLAEKYAKNHEIDYKGYPAKWTKYGLKAGYIRNKKMLEDNPDIELVIAFPGGKGTKMMTELAEESNFKVLKIKDNE